MQPSCHLLFVSIEICLLLIIDLLLIVFVMDVGQALHEAGAKKVVVLGLGPLGCTPAFRILNTEESGQCLEPVNKLVEETNAGLKTIITDLNNIEGFTIVLGDIYPLHVDAVKKPAFYGTLISLPADPPTS